MRIDLLLTLNTKFPSQNIWSTYWNVFFTKALQSLKIINNILNKEAQHCFIPTKKAVNFSHNKVINFEN